MNRFCVIHTETNQASALPVILSGSVRNLGRLGLCRIPAEAGPLYFLRRSGFYSAIKFVYVEMLSAPARLFNPPAPGPYLPPSLPLGIPGVGFLSREQT